MTPDSFIKLFDQYIDKKNNETLLIYIDSKLILDLILFLLIL